MPAAPVPKDLQDLDTDEPEPAPRRHRGLAYLGIGAAASLSLLLLASYTPRAGQRPIAPPPPPAPSAASSPPGSRSTPESPALAPAPPKAAPVAVEARRSIDRAVSIEIRTSPARAQLLVDGEPVANPYRGRFSTSDWNHLVEGRAPGYASKTTGVLFDRDRRVTLALSPQATAPVVKNQTLILDYPQ